MKKAKGILTVTIVCTIAILSCTYSYLLLQRKNNLLVKKNNHCRESSLYYEKNGRKIYTYCLDSVQLNKTELKLYDNVFKAVETLKNDLKVDIIYKDGGTVMYRNFNISILMCHTLDGNEDIYIGPKTMIYEQDFCKNI